MKRVLSFLAAVLASTAVGQDDLESRDPVTSSALRYEAGGPSTVGDPVRVSDLTIAHDETDLVVNTSIGSFAFTRKYSSTMTWKDIWTAKLWFGSSSADGGIGITHWWSSVASYATLVQRDGFPPGPNGDPVPPSVEVQVREPSGDLVSTVDFGELGGDFANGSGGTRIELDGPRLADGRLMGYENVNRVTLIRPGVGRFRYGHVSEFDVNTRVGVARYRRLRRYRLIAVYPDSYAADGGLGTPICTFSSSGASCFGGQEVTWARGESGSNASALQVSSLSLNGEVQVRYSYVSGGLDSVVRTATHESYSPAEQATTYAYTVAGTPGFAVSSRTATESRVLFEKQRGGTLERCNGEWGPIVSSAVNTEATPSGGFTYAPVYPQGQTCFWGSQQTTAVQSSLTGETVTQTFSVPGGTTLGVALACDPGTTGDCSSMSNASAGWGVNNWAEPVDFVRRDFRSSYTVLTHSDLETSNYIRDTEVTAVRAGASTSSGTDALSVRNYTWQYADENRTHQRLPATESAGSLLQTGGTTTTHWQYDLTSKRLEVVSSGVELSIRRRDESSVRSRPTFRSRSSFPRGRPAGVRRGPVS